MPDPREGALRVLVNGSPASKGTIENTGLETRTFFFRAAKITDLEWLKGVSQAAHD